MDETRNVTVRLPRARRAPRALTAASGCDGLWTEDLNDGQVIRGVRVRNPVVPR